MDRHLSKSLIGLLVVIAITHLASGHSLYFGRSQDVEDEIPDRTLLEETNIDPANELENFDNFDNSVNLKKPAFRPSTVPVIQLDGIRHETENKHGASNRFKGRQQYGSKSEEEGESRELEDVKHGVDLEEGDSYELVCTVSAGTEAHVYWIRGDDPEQKIKIEERSKSRIPPNFPNMDRNRLTQVQLKHVIECASQKDVGLIHCVAIDGDEMSVGSTRISVKESSKRFRSHKPCKPKRVPRIIYHTATMMSMIGSTVMLTCEANGPQTVDWYINDEQIFDLKSSRYQLSGNNLLIRDIEWNDMGVFICKATTDYGVAQADTFLYPLAAQ